MEIAFVSLLVLKIFCVKIVVKMFLKMVVTNQLVQIFNLLTYLTEK